MLVSVIVPVYNVEKYLDRCIQSIVNQSFTQLDIVLVDDGSTDQSGEMCDKYALMDSRIKVIHKENGGLSSARNMGMVEACGEYITFVDSDDYLADYFIEELVSMCEESKSQIGIMQMQYIAEDTNECINANKTGKYRTLNAEEAIEASLYQILFSCCAPAKIYRRSILNNVSFPEGKLSEDLATCHLFLANASKIVFTEDIGYYYRQRNNSIMLLSDEL